MRGAGLMAALAFACSAASAAAAPLPVSVGGRAAALPGGGGWVFGWPGVYFEGRFRGRSVTVVAESAADHLAVLVDGVEKARLTAPGRARLTVSGLGGGVHVVRLQKLTESQTGGSRFYGFFTDKGGVALSPPTRTRQIEFIGDSYTVGYGDTSPKRSCTRAEIHDTTDTRQAFGPLIAERLGADYQVVAYSGFGVVRNYAGSSPGQSMPGLYPRTVPGDAASAWRRPVSWRPQLVVIGLGTNDFSTPLKAGEAWPDQAALRSDYRARYLAFARAILSRPERPRLVLLAQADWADEVRAVAKALEAPDRVRVISYQDLELGGCDYHPSLADHRKLAELIGETVSGFGDIWTRRR